MKLNVAIQMDAAEGLNHRSDSTVYLGIEATKRGHALHYYQPKHLSFRDGDVNATAQPITFYDDEKRYFELGEKRTLDLKTQDVVLLRQDPPFDMTYITTTHVLEHIHPKTLVVNNPAEVRNAPEKWMVQRFPQFLPPTLISADENVIRAFHKEMKDIVIKPLYGHGGQGVFKLGASDANIEPLLEFLFMHSSVPVIAQRFLPEVKDQDRRIILIDGEFKSVFGRIPNTGEIRANFRVGGSAAKAELTGRQEEIVVAVGPELKKRGLIFVGLDVIGDYLTEINVTSPTGLRAVEKLYNKNLAVDFWDTVEALR